VSIEPRFIFPSMLVLLVLVPIAIYIGAKIQSLPLFRKWTAITLRTIILIALILALAGMEVVRQSDKLAVFFILDQSNSVPEQIQFAAMDSVRTIAELYMEDDDEAGVIVFGDRPSIEMSVGETLELGDIRSYFGREQTDLAAAIRLAMAAFPQGYMKRMVIYSDGNETQGSALEEAKLAKANDVEVDVIPLIVEGGNEVRVREVGAPSRVSADEPFQVQVVIQSDQETEATLRLSRSAGGDTRLFPEQQVQLQKGDNTLVLTQEIPGSGFFEYEAIVEAPGDTVLANNEGRAYTVVQGEPTVLYVDRSFEDSPYLGPALQSEGVRTHEVNVANLPASLPQLQSYDAVVLSDVSATDLSREQMNSIEAMVRDLGIGLVMVGGPNSYGAGGYHETPVERALPLNMDLKQRKVIPRGALVIVVDKSGSMAGEKLDMAKRAAIAAVQVLSNQDYIGVICFDSSPYRVVDMQTAEDKRRIIGDIGTIGSGGGTNMYTGLEQAYYALSQVEASVKHCIVLSDGRSEAGNFGGIVSRMAEDAITVSTVGVGTDSDRKLMSDIAGWGRGRYHFTDNPHDIPQIFTKEAAVIRRKMLIEGEFQPQPKHESELLLSMGEGLPPLQGYVATTPKETATIALTSHEDDPVLAHWRYGLGKSVAFTSDATTRWAGDWVNWEGFNPFWAQSVRWAMRETSRSGFQIETFVRDGKGHVRIDAVDETGNFVNFLRPNATVTGPGPDFARTEVDFSQTGPGIYESNFPADDRGTYMVNITYRDAEGNEGMIPAGLAVNYSREYEYNTTNRALLDQLASYGGGKVMNAFDNPFVNNLPAAPRVTPIWPWLVAIAVCLLPIEIFVRRVVVDFSPAVAAVAKAFHAVPGLGRLVRVPAPRAARPTGVYGNQMARSYTFTPTLEDGADEAAVLTSGGTLEGAVKAPTARAAPEKDDGPRQGSSDYTRQLLAAKERALDRKRRRSAEDNEENE
jgi:uncharacterized membrane protein